MDPTSGFRIGFHRSPDFLTVAQTRDVERTSGGQGRLGRGRWSIKGGQGCGGISPQLSLVSPDVVTDWLCPLMDLDAMLAPDLPEETPGSCEASSGSFKCTTQ